MNNTFWTLIEDKYYRVHDGMLKYAPICQETNNIDTNQESKVEVISSHELENINSVLGSSFLMDDF